ncbi:hypothetical protein G7046_g3079 [Stylonectria norvegica]|nr:hypothetical protein G7046_g3079 [Stylonectria norvegica]
MPEVIDLISSSPPPSLPVIDSPLFVQDSQNAPASPRPHSRGITRGYAATSREAAPTAAPRHAALESAGFVFLSDDFDTTGDLDEPIIATSAGNKRQRLSPPEKRNARPPERSLSGPSLQSNRRIHADSNVHQPQAIADPIEFSSSYGGPVPTKKEEPIKRVCSPVGPLHRNRGIVGGVVDLLQEDSDPFASSPRPTPRPANKPPEAKQAELSDPFASSPPRVGSPGNKRKSHNEPAHSQKRVSSALGPKAASPKYNRDWDPISSSAPQVGSFASSPPGRKTTRGPSSRPIVIDVGDSDSQDGSEDEFPDIANFDVTKFRAQPRTTQIRRTQSEVISSRSRPKTTKSGPKPVPKSAEEKTREKEAKAAEREAEKERKRKEREQAKEAKAREKEQAAALAEVNKLRTDKKVSTPEMIVDLPSSLSPTIKCQLETMLEALDVQYTAWDSPLENVIKWRRKVRSKFNEDIGLWEPISLRIHEEKHVLVTLTADEFVTLALADDLESHVEKMEEHFRNHEIIYLLEGLTPWMRKNRNLRNRQFTSGVRQESTNPTQARRKKSNAAEYIPEETIEDALLQLQVMHDVLIHHTTIPLETAEWISVFTQHVSTTPYRKERDRATQDTAFCMESGQVKTGEDAKDTYIRMLQEIARVTAPIAYGVAAEFSNVSDLVNGMEREGPVRLEGVRKSANKDGAFSDRAIGQAVSRRMHKVFTGRDDSSTEV